VPWAWQEVSQGSAVYAIPGDAGLMALYYNSALLAKYHITPPINWTGSGSGSDKAGTLTADVRVVEPLGSELHATASPASPALLRPRHFDPDTGLAIDWPGNRTPDPWPSPSATAGVQALDTDT
jgi:ABC-type glycerol-3-phosphate transport system substrate-binding protein